MVISRLRFGAILAVGAGVLAGSVLVTLPAQAKVSTSECAAVITIVARGTDEARGTEVTTIYKNVYSSGTGMGRAGALAKDYQAKSAKTMRITGLRYAAANLLAYAVSEGDGTATLVSELNRLATKCPSSKTVLIGFSQGAHLIGDALAKSRAASKQPSAAAKSRVAAVLLYGDPMYNPNESFVTLKSPKRYGMLGTRATGDLSAFQSRIKSYCLTGDPACQGSATFGGYNRAALTNSAGLAIHNSYFASGKSTRTGGLSFLYSKTG